MTKNKNVGPAIILGLILIEFIVGLTMLVLVLNLILRG